MPRLRIADIPADSPVDPPAHLDPATVARYRADLEAMAPVVVFRTPEGLLLADGHHRVAAALAAGRDTIDAEVREGSRGDALRYAIEVGAVQRNLSPGEVADRMLARYGRAPRGSGTHGPAEDDPSIRRSSGRR